MRPAGRGLESPGLRYVKLLIHVLQRWEGGGILCIVSDCEYFQNFEGALTFNDVIVISWEDRPRWYFLKLMVRGDPLLIGSKHNGMTFDIEIPYQGGNCNNLPLEDVLQKTPQKN